MFFFKSFQNVETKGVLKVAFVDYVNPKSGVYDGGCCDSLICRPTNCETYFEICLQSTNTPKASQDNCMVFVKTKLREGDSFTFKDAYGTTFGVKGEKNPLVYHFDDSWGVCDYLSVITKPLSGWGAGALSNFGRVWHNIYIRVFKQNTTSA